MSAANPGAGGRGPTNVSFRAGDLIRDLTPRIAAGETPGPVARRHLHRYYALLATTLAGVTFTSAEAHLLTLAADVLLEHAPADSFPSHRWLWAALDDATRGKTIDAVSVALIERVRELSPVESLAVLDALERVQAARSHGLPLTDELLRDVGLLRD